MTLHIKEVRPGQLYQDIDGQRRGRVTARYLTIIERENCDGLPRWVCKDSRNSRFTSILGYRLLDPSRFSLIIDPAKIPVPAQLAGY